VGHVSSLQSAQGKQAQIQMATKVPKKILTLAAAHRWAVAAQRRGQRVVATNGCFDLLHYGHVRYLQRARELGDLLVVGLNSDRSVQALKGLTRPLVPERQRAVVIAGLECVDAVVVFNEVRCLRFLRAVQPDVYVKGGDYKPETLDPQERAVLDAVGSQIKILAFEPGFSTTELIKKMRAG